MKRHLLVLMTVLLGWTAGAQAEDYTLWINGVQVTDANASDLTKIDGVSFPAQGRGRLMYSPVNNRLVLDHVSIGNIGDMEAGIKSSISGLQIVVIGTCSIQGKYGTAAIEVTKDATLRCDEEYGMAYLSVFNSNANGAGIKVLASPGSIIRPNSTTLTIGDCVSITSQAAQAVVGSRLSYATTQLVFSGKQSELSAFGTKENYGCISHFSEITLGEGYFLDQPDGAVIDGGAVKKDGSVYVSETNGAWIRQGVQFYSTNFPDAGFRHFLWTEVDSDPDGWLSESDVASAIMFNLDDKNIASLQGIEYFPNLLLLYCQNNKLTSLDLSNNKELTQLFCFNNQLTTLDVSGNTKLEMLLCDNNQLTALSVSPKNGALKHVRCEDNRLDEKAMEALVTNLPTWNASGVLFAKDLADKNEQNVITPAQVHTAKQKGWTVYAVTSAENKEYNGDGYIEPIDNDETCIDLSDLADEESLANVVVDNVYYNTILPTAATMQKTTAWLSARPRT